MTVVHGFELTAQTKIDEIKAEARLYRHVKTGAELLSLVNDDENKVFGISFRTPPRDSTGVAHILEHSVLCGSRKYPVKEPFVELLKGSLKTFLNAFTFPDKTCYPVASQNVQDFYNLIDVYLDAVFYPRLTPEVLMQEGWHLEAESEDGPLTYQGVVYGEMKGVYSSPDSVLNEAIQQSLFPDVTYGLDSGGDPREIPNLTFEAFSDFHARYYHPSNARIFFWGDDDPDERLKLVDAYLSSFERREVDSAVGLQAHFDAPRKVKKPYAASDPGEQGRAMVTVNWLLPEVTHRELNLGLHVLEQILVGTSAAPLRKALIDSDLGEDLAGVGLESDLRQMFFSTGLKGIEEKNADAVEELILRVLRELADRGIDRDLISASLNSIEFRLRESNTGSFPKGLSYMLQSLRTWLYNDDPLALIAFEAPLEALKKSFASGEPYFENLIRAHLLDNPHRTTVLLVPDPEEGKRRDDDERSRLEAVRAGMDEAAVRSIIEKARLLKERQQKPDEPEDLATIPSLHVADLPRDNKHIPIAEETIGDGVPLYFHDLNSFGIAYLDLGFDLSVIAQDDIPLLPLFGRALTQTGTSKEDFVSLSRRITANTGGVGAATYTSASKAGHGSAAWLMLRSKAMQDKVPALTAILSDVLAGARFDDRDRIRQLVLEEKAQTEEGLVPSGHAVVDARLRASFGESAWLDELTDGVSYLLFLRELVEKVDSDWPAIQARLFAMRDLLFNRRNMIANLTLDAPGFAAIRTHLDALVNGLPSREPQRATWKRDFAPGFEGFTIPAQVNFVGKGGNLFDLGYKYHGSSIVISKFLRNTWLWDRVRVQGGAYGSFCRLDRLSGVFTLVSYRDPNIERTVENFDETARFLREVPLTQEEIDKSIIGAIGDLDTYMLPDTKGYVSFARRLTHQDDDDLKRLRQEIFETREEHFRAFGDVLGELASKGIVAVLGGAEGVNKASSKLSLKVTALL